MKPEAIIKAVKEGREFLVHDLPIKTIDALSIYEQGKGDWVMNIVTLSGQVQLINTKFLSIKK